MIRFTRMATAKGEADTPRVLSYANEITGMLNKRYKMHMRVGRELLGKNRFYWTFEVNSLDELHELNKKLDKDREYWSFVEKGKDYWVQGTREDTIVELMD